MLVEERGVPLSLVVTGANRHDVTQLEIVLDTIVIERPKPTPDQPHHLCADKAYDGKDAMQIIVQRGYIPHVRRPGEEIEAKKNRSRLPRSSLDRRSMPFMVQQVS